MILLRSTFSLSSRAFDRIALLDPKALAKAAAAKGHQAAALVDERTMAGSLAFLASCADEKIAGTAGISISDLKTQDADLRLTFIPLNQDGLRRLIKVNDILARAVFFDDAIGAFPLGDSSDPINIAVLISPHKAPTGSPRYLDRAVYLSRRLGPVVASISTAGEELQSAPIAPAEHSAAASGIAYGAFTAAYAGTEPTEKAKAALASVCQNNTSVQDLPAWRRRPQTLTCLALQDAPKTLDPVVEQLAAKLQPMTLKRKPSLPSRSDARDVFRAEVEAGLQRRLARGQIADEALARERIAEELDVIETLGFPDYFLIMREAIRFAREKKIPVGPGRGSAAGSLVTYCLGVTNIEPLRYGLLFERFLNPSRVSLPDIDTDFCELRRGEVIDHMATVYGDENVAQIATYGSRKTRGSIREAARVLGLRPAGENLIQLLAPIEKEEKPFDILTPKVTDPEMSLVLDIAKTLSGTAAHQGIHAGGIIISDAAIREDAPILPERSDIKRPVIAFDMKATEDAGFVKFDFLGLSALSVMALTVKNLTPIRQAQGLPPLELDDLLDDPTDPKVFEMIRKGQTRTIFQLEGGGITAAAKEIAVECFEDIVALVALYRPGPMAYISTYAARKRGEEPIEYPHPSLEPITKATYGIMIYQEQIMQMAQAFAGYNMAEADNLRRAIGKKIKAAVMAEEKTFVAKALEVGQSEKKALEMFEFVQPFALYGFNKSHAVAYASISYQTAWLKAHYPAEWFAACLEFESDAEKRQRIIQDAERSDIPVLRPALGQSDASHWKTVDQNGKRAILMPLTAIKGVNEAAAAAIVSGLKNNRPKSLTELMTECSGLGTSQSLALIRAGLLDYLRPEHPRIVRPILSYLAENKLAAGSRKAKTAGQTSLFDALDMPESNDPSVNPAESHLYRPLDLDEMAIAESDAFQGAFNHRKSSETSSDWLAKIEKMATLERAVEIGRQTITRTTAIVRNVTDRIVPRSDGSSERRISLTLADHKFEVDLDLARGITADTVIDHMKGKSVILTLSPSRGDAFIASKPEITSIDRPRHPLDEPRRFPVIEIDGDLTPELEREIMMNIRRSSTKGPTRRTKDNHEIVRASHLIVIAKGKINPVPVGTHVDQTLCAKLFATMTAAEIHPATAPDPEPAALRTG